jgi:hypothetical protein
MSEVTIHTFGFLWFMKGRLQVLSVEHSAVTAVPFPLAQLHNLQQQYCATECVKIFPIFPPAY